MNYKSLAAWTLLGFLTLGTLGYKSKDNLDSKLSLTPFTRTIANHNYRFQGNTVTELSSDADDQAIYGVISDAHGERKEGKV